MRNSKKTRFCKTIGVTIEHYTYIDKTKSRKSKAGRLEEIVDLDLHNFKIDNPHINI